jgi:hypothetical protein
VLGAQVVHRFHDPPRDQPREAGRRIEARQAGTGFESSTFGL